MNAARRCHASSHAWERIGAVRRGYLAIFRAARFRFSVGLGGDVLVGLWRGGRIAFQGSPIPMRPGGGSVVGCLQKREQRLGGLLRGAHRFIGEYEFAQFFVEISGLWLNRIFIETGRSGI